MVSGPFGDRLRMSCPADEPYGLQSTLRFQSILKKKKIFFFTMTTDNR